MMMNVSVLCLFWLKIIKEIDLFTAFFVTLFDSIPTLYMEYMLENNFITL